MAIDREKESQAAQLYRGKEDDDLDTYEHSGESLLSLVQPELANLSSHWFHALKDHALLSLPPGEEWNLKKTTTYFVHFVVPMGISLM